MENEYDQQFILYNSQVCRLCCVENANGSMLFLSDEDDISILINTYLPIKVSEPSAMFQFHYSLLTKTKKPVAILYRSGSCVVIYDLMQCFEEFHLFHSQVTNDGTNPRWICPGCHLQVEATVEFFDLVIAGQDKLREILKLQQSSTDVYILGNDGHIEDATTADNAMTEGTFAVIS